MAGKSLGEIFNQQLKPGAMSEFVVGDTPDQIIQRVPVVGGKELVCIFNFNADEREVTGFLVKGKNIDILGVKPLSDVDAVTINAALIAKAKL